MILFRLGFLRRLRCKIDQLIELLPETESEFRRRIVLREQELRHEYRLKVQRNIEAVEAVDRHDDHHFGDVVQMEFGLQRVFAGESDIGFDVFLMVMQMSYMQAMLILFSSLILGTIIETFLGNNNNIEYVLK